MAGLVNWPRHLMLARFITIATLPIALCLETWLAVLLYRRQVYKLAPVFSSYIVISVPVSLVRVLTVQHYAVYYFVYWSSELLLILLSLAALNEVFWYTYKGFDSIWWLRPLYYGAILVALGVTIRMAIVSPPVVNHPLVSFMLDAEITANMVRGGIVALFAALVKPMAVRFQRYPFGIILGFGVSSVGPSIAYFAFSAFGTKVVRSTDLISTLSYIIALVIWLRIFSLPDTKLTKWEPPIPPEEMLDTVEGYMKALGVSRKRKRKDDLRNNCSPDSGSVAGSFCHTVPRADD
ncbi:MAG TPA: hypothetical protein VHW72_22725 [Candidatus Angelobacter sp.]|nr:hypothetical protein [Candidatus Angelobacter sp.]